MSDQNQKDLCIKKCKDAFSENINPIRKVAEECVKKCPPSLQKSTDLSSQCIEKCTDELLGDSDKFFEIQVECIRKCDSPEEPALHEKLVDAGDNCYNFASLVQDPLHLL